MKPQTFDEWHSENATWLAIHGITVYDARSLWRTVMENAARICEEVNRTTGECPELATYCAEAIREAAKR